MRTTNSMMSRQLLGNLSLNYKKLVKYQAQVSTGKAFQRASESPFNAVAMIDLKAKLGKIEQYKKNSADSMAVTRDIESGLSSINESLVNIKEIILRGLNGTYTLDERISMAEILEAQKGSMITELNREFSGKYLFGGNNMADAPFKDASGSIEYNGIDLSTMSQAQFDTFAAESRQIKIAAGTNIDTALPGVTVTGFGEDNLLNVIDELITIYRTTPFDSQRVLELDAKNEGYIKTVQNNISKMGGRQIRLEAIERRLAENEFSLSNLYHSLEGVDIEKAVIDFKTAEMVYNAALSSGARIIQPTLIDYLR